MKYYLATTGHSQLWDPESKLLFLGPWCLSGYKRGRIEEGYTLIPSPWKPAIKLKEAADYCYHIYTGLLPEISGELNRIHAVSYPERYWQVLTGPWLLSFTKVLYERYRRIENAVMLFPDLYTHTLPLKSCNILSDDTLDFMGAKAVNDSYNLRLFSIISHELIPGKIRESEFLSEPKSFSNGINFNWKCKIFNILFKRFFSRGEVLLSDMYHFRNIDRILIKLKSGHRQIGFIDFFDKNLMHLNTVPFNEGLRHSISLKGAKDEFQTLLYRMIPSAISKCYIENFKGYTDYIDTIKGIEKIKAIGSSVGWWYNEPLKYLAARAVLSNAKLVEFQHGGGYDMLLSSLAEATALEKDYFYTWGKGPAGNDKIKHLPSLYLSRLKNRHSQKNDSILFVGMSMPRYHYRFMTFLQPDDMLRYIENKRIFLKNLAPSLKDNLLYRPPYSDGGWGEAEILKQEFPGIRYVPKGSLVDLMKRARLVVIDHPHTSFIEALTINVPCIFYWDRDVYLMRSGAEYYIELLRKVGVLYEDPLSAAEKANNVFNNALEWWKKDDIQSARDEFCRRYAFTRENSLDLWIKELRTLTTEPVSEGYFSSHKGEKR